MQLLEVPYTEDKTSTRGYYLKAHEGIFAICARMWTRMRTNTLYYIIPDSTKNHTGIGEHCLVSYSKTCNKLKSSFRWNHNWSLTFQRRLFKHVVLKLLHNVNVSVNVQNFVEWPLRWGLYLSISHCSGLCKRLKRLTLVLLGISHNYGLCVQGIELGFRAGFFVLFLRDVTTQLE